MVSSALAVNPVVLPTSEKLNFTLKYVLRKGWKQTSECKITNFNLWKNIFLHYHLSPTTQFQFNTINMRDYLSFTNLKSSY